MWRSSIPLSLVILSAQIVQGEARLLKEEVPSKFLNAARTFRMYLPPSYSQETDHRYPVLYLPDGQNLFSSAGTNICFGWGNWELDKTVDELSRTKKMQEVILVAIDNSPARYASELVHRIYQREKVEDVAKWRDAVQFPEWSSPSERDNL